MANAYENGGRTRNPFIEGSDPTWWRNTFRVIVLIVLLALLGLCIASVVGIFRNNNRSRLCEVIHTDYLVVGGGSAGIINAKVLSDAGFKTL